ncbi:MAG TPA: GNAT family N-acetyltransferase [Candidatus Udaeobacter sp.]
MRTVFRIETASLVLRPLVPGDTQRMLEMSQEDCARRWLPSQIYRDKRHAGTAIEYLIGQFNLDASPTTNAFVFGVEEKVTGRLIGHVGLSPFFDSVEVGFGIATSEQRKGYATEGVARVCAWALERFSLPAIVGVTDKENVASQRVLIRCGFSRKEEKLMRLQGVDRPAVVFELAKKEPNQSAVAHRRPALQSDGSGEFARDCCSRPGVSGGGR